MTDMSRDEIKAALDAAEVVYDGRASTERLAALLPSQDAAKAPDERLVTVRVLRAFWPEEDQRVEKGAVIDVTTDEALDGIENGMFERVK